MTQEQQTNAGTRMGSMLVDHFAMSFIATIFFVPGLISTLSSSMAANHEPMNPDIFGSFNYFGLIGFALYFCKDSIYGRSLGKIVFKLQVANNVNGQVASPIKCFIRNIFCILWPIEVFVTLFSPSRRIGDMVAGTKVVPYNPELERPSLNFVQIVLSLVLAYGIIVLCMLPLKALNSTIKQHQVNYVESSINKMAAEETEKLFADSLSTQLTADVVVYDHIKENEDLKYVSVILRLNENYLNNDIDFEKIQSLTLPLLLSKFPKGSFVGQIKYVYQQPGSFQSRTRHLDWR